jgi:hypothetical protein
MTSCAYCDQKATTKIISSPERVCLEHALEFWHGLMDYARDHSGPCTREEGPCACRTCEELAVAYVHTHAIAAAGPSPADGAPFRLRLAS